MTDNALVLQEPGQLQSWEGAAERGLQARRERERIIAQVLKPNLDFGVIPGTPKPTLLKAGAEKIVDSLNLYPDYEIITRTENWDAAAPVFAYAYRCILRLRASQIIIATGIGSCNSLEGRYRWRNAERLCPECKLPTIIKGKKQFGGGWLCWQKRGGCGAKFGDTDERITGQSADRVPNEDIFSQVNTIDKMAQKRALVAATLNLGFSEQFTQDLEDANGNEHETEPEKPVEQPKRKSEAEAKPTEAGPTWTGLIKEITEKSGTKKNGERWTLYEIHGEKGERFGTFSKTIHDKAAAFQMMGEPVLIRYTVTEKGGWNITSIEQAAELV